MSRTGILEKQTATFAVEVKDGIVTRIGRSFIAVSEVRFRGCGTEWAEDRHKETVHGKERKTWERS